ncbi:hypothetical protein F4782DRAFT_496140 [Xylaria castorea]|nr:hypothetical protein F4782DRAFT_496140 [Xylaria castorea]
MSEGGFYVYKWQGKYYANRYNGWNSYPPGSGEMGVGQIPSNPEHYQIWLQKMRSYYSDVAKKFDEVFTISMNNLGEKSDHEDSDPKGFNRLTVDNQVYHEDTGITDLGPAVSWLAPESSRYINSEWVNVIDLDRELFGICDTFFYHLSKIPPQFEDLMEEAKIYWQGNVDLNEIHKSITTNDVHSTPLTGNPTPAFLQMKPITVCPKQESRLNRMPAFVACNRLYKLFLQYYRREMRQAQDSHIESDFLFKELVFPLMCFASCSPTWVRLISTTNMLYESDRCGRRVCGVILDHGSTRKPKEFVTGFLQGYHLEGMETGSAPKSTSYWFAGALVYLRRDITSRERLHDAIVSVVTKGKADGRTHFSAIIVSFKHFVLLKFADGTVQHTERLNLGVYREYLRDEVLSLSLDCDNVIGEPGEEHESFDDSSDDSFDDSPDDSFSFEILAHFFDATQNQGLKPSIVHNEGVFPDEVYRRIISYVDRETNIACLQVSRPFREFASETFVMDDGLKLVYRPGKKPECFHEWAGFVGPFRPGISWQVPEDFHQWIPVFGAPDGSASMELKIALEIPSSFWA